MFEPAAPSEELPLPETARGWKEQVERYVEKRSRESLSRRYAVLETRRILVGVGGALNSAGLACLPSRLGDAQLDHLLNVVWRPSLDGTRGLASKTRRYYTCVLNGFLKDSGNLALERRKLKFPKGSVRPKKALTEEESGRLLRVASAMGIVPHAVVALEMTMGLRRCEVLRVSLDDLEDGELLVHGKGRGGEKLRRVPYHPEVQRILPELLAHRTQVLQGYRGPDDGRVFVHRDGEGRSGLEPQLGRLPGAGISVLRSGDPPSLEPQPLPPAHVRQNDVEERGPARGRQPADGPRGHPADPRLPRDRPGGHGFRNVGPWTRDPAARGGRSLIEPCGRKRALSPIEAGKNPSGPILGGLPNITRVAPVREVLIGLVCVRSRGSIARRVFRSPPCAPRRAGHAGYSRICSSRTDPLPVWHPPPVRGSTVHRRRRSSLRPRGLRGARVLFCEVHSRLLSRVPGDVGRARHEGVENRRDRPPRPLPGTGRILRQDPPRNLATGGADSRPGLAGNSPLPELGGPAPDSARCDTTNMTRPPAIQG